MKMNSDIYLSNELRALFSAIRQAEWNKEVSELFERSDKDKLVSLAEKHRISPLIFNYLNHHPWDIKSTIQSELKSLAKEHLFKTLRLQSELLKICESFSQNKIEYIVLKGPQLSHLLYKDATTRVCVDLDIFLKKKANIKSASEILLKLGYNLSNFPKDNRIIRRKMFGIGKHETAFFNRQTKTYVDLHLRPIGNTLFSARFHRIFFSDVQAYELNGIRLSIPSMENYFLFLCYHGSVHQYASLHWLADVYTFLKKFPVPLDQLERLASKLRLKKHFMLTLMLINSLFGYPLPETYLNTPGRKRTIIRLYNTCIISISREQRLRYTLKERWQKTMYRFILAEGLFGKVDTLITILFRYLYRVVNTHGMKMVRKD